MTSRHGTSATQITMEIFTLFLKLAVAAALLGAALLPARAGQTWTVGDGEDYATIQEAIDAAAAGDVIEAGDGVYEETIDINVEGLTVQSANGAAVTTIRGAGSGASGATVRITADNVTLAGFTIDNEGGEPGCISGGNNAANATIRNNVLTNSARGVRGDFYGRFGAGLVIDNNVFDGVTRGITNTEDIPSITVTDNTFQNIGANAVSFGARVMEVVITGNTFDDIAGRHIANYEPDSDFDLAEAFGSNAFDKAAAVNDVASSIVQAIYSTISLAISEAGPGATIQVAAGEYEISGMTLTQPVTLRGANAGIPAADGSGTVPEGRGDETVLIVSNEIWPHADNITIDGFHLRSGERVIRCQEDANNLTIINSILESTGGNETIHFIGTGDRADLIIANNRFIGTVTHAAILFSGAEFENAMIKENDFVGTFATALKGGSAGPNIAIEENYFGPTITTGINMNMMVEPIIRNNIFDNLGYVAIQIGSVGGLIENNYIDGASTGHDFGEPWGVLAYGIVVFGDAHGSKPSEGLVIRGNTIKNLQPEAPESEGNWNAISIGNNAGPNITIEGNLLENNHVAVRSRTGEGGISLQGNAFIGNTLAVLNVVEEHTIDANANYWGTDDPDFGDLVSGDVSTDTWYTDEEMTALASSLPVENITQNAFFATIQAAINAAAAGDTIEVAPGTYAERLVIDRAVALIGPNADKAGYAGHRAAEAIIQLAEPESLENGTYVLVSITASDVTIKGITFRDNVTSDFTYDGTWPLTHFVAGIVGYESNTLIENNRFIGFNYIPVRMMQTPAHNTQTTEAKTGNVTRSNFFEGSTVYHAIYYQASAGIIENNVIENAVGGIQIQPYFTNASGIVSGNQFSVFGSGLYYNYANWTIDDGALWTFEGNTITGAAAPDWSKLTWTGSAGRFQGIRVETYLQDEPSAPRTFEPKASFVNNIIDGNGASSALSWTGVSGLEFRNIKGAASLNHQNVTFADNTFINVEVGVRFDEEADCEYDISVLLENGNAYPDGMVIIPPFQLGFAAVTNLTQELGYVTIQSAIDASAEGDTITVAAGLYEETVTLNTAGITLRSTGGRDVTTLRGGTIDFMADGITLEGFTIDSTDTGRAIATRSSSNTTIRDNRVTGSALRAIQGADYYGKPFGQGQDNTLITGNIFTGMQNGIAGTERMTNLTITNNVFEGARLGIGADVGAMTVTGNTFTGDAMDLRCLTDYRYSAEDDVVVAPTIGDIIALNNFANGNYAQRWHGTSGTGAAWAILLNPATIGADEVVEISGTYTIPAGVVQTIEGGSLIVETLNLEEGAVLQVVNGSLTLAAADGGTHTISGTFTVFDSFGSVRLEGDTLFDGGQLFLISNIHVDDGVVLTVSGSLTLDGCVIDSEGRFTIDVLDTATFRMARCIVVNADISIASDNTEIRDNLFDDVAIEVAGSVDGAEIFHNIMEYGAPSTLTINPDAEVTTEVDGWGNVATLADTRNDLTLDFDDSELLTGRTYDAATGRLFLQPGDLARIRLDVGKLLDHKIQAVEAMMGYSTNLFELLDPETDPPELGVELQEPWQVDLYEQVELSEEFMGTYGLIDTMVGLNMSTEDREGTDADETVAKITLQTRADKEGITVFFFRLRQASDHPLLDTRLAVNETGQPQDAFFLTPFTLNTSLVTVDGTDPLVANLAAEQNQAGVTADVFQPGSVTQQGTVLVSVDAFDALAGIADEDVTLEIALDSDPGILLDAELVANDPVMIEGEEGIRYTFAVPITPATVNGIYVVTMQVADRSGNTVELPAETLTVDKNQVAVTVALQGAVAGPFLRNVVFTATNDAGDVLETWSDLLEFAGGEATVDLTRVPDSTTHLSAKADLSLRRRLPVELNAEGQGSVDFTGADHLLGGDLTGDNVVATLDFATLRANWLTNNTVADITGSGNTGTVDFDILRGNWLKIGDAE